MNFGLFNLTTLSTPRGDTAALLAETRLEVQLAEDLGFEIAWFAEHHFSNYSIISSPLLLVSHMAAATSRIRLGPAVIVLPFYEPMRLAEDVCLADAVTAGRLVLGLGFGYQPREFIKFGIPVAERYQRGLEAWDLIEQATTGRMQQRGTFVSADVDVAVTPVQDAIPTFVVGSDPVVMKTVAARGSTPFVTPGVQPLSVAKRIRDTYSEVYGPSMPFAVQRYVFVSDNANERHAAAEQVRNVARMTGNLRPRTSADGRCAPGATRAPGRAIARRHRSRSADRNCFRESPSGSSPRPTCCRCLISRASCDWPTCPTTWRCARSISSAPR